MGKPIKRLGGILRTSSNLGVAFRRPHSRQCFSSWARNDLRVGAGLVGTGLFAASVSMTWACVANPAHADAPVDDTSTPQSFLRQIFNPIISTYDEMNEVLCGDQSILLPMAVPDPYGRPLRTVCINFEKTLVYPMWTRDFGWTVRKRPYVDMFLERLARAGYEVVLFSDSNQFDAEQNVMELDKMGVLKHKLFKESTNFKQGRYVKDLSRLGRDLRNVVLIDHNFLDSASLQPENAIHIKPFIDDLKDKELYRLTLFLENIQKHNMHDMREVIKKYNKNPNVNHFKAEEAMALEYERQLAEEEGTVAPRAKSSGSSWLGSLGGVLRKSK